MFVTKFSYLASDSANVNISSNWAPNLQEKLNEAGENVIMLMMQSIFLPELLTGLLHRVHLGIKLNISCLHHVNTNLGIGQTSYFYQMFFLRNRSGINGFCFLQLVNYTRQSHLTEDFLLGTGSLESSLLGSLGLHLLLRLLDEVFLWTLGSRSSSYGSGHDCHLLRPFSLLELFHLREKQKLRRRTRR